MTKYFPALTVFGLVLAIALSGPVQAGKKGYWTWTDQKGNPQYADLPPEGVDAVFVEKNTLNSAVSEGVQTGSQNDDGAAASGPQAIEGIAAKDPEICQQAKNNLAALESARVRITDPDGSKRFLTEDEKAAQRERAQKFIDLNCE